MSKAQEALPPSYEEAVHGTVGTFAGASAPILPSPEHAPLVQGAVTPMPPVATEYSGHISVAMPGIVPVPPMAVPTVPSPQPPLPQGQMPMYPIQQPAAPATTGKLVSYLYVLYVSPPPVGPKPCTLTCPVCHQKVRTTTTVTNAGSAHAICILMCLLGSFALLPVLS
ncbi:Protein of unknown function [Gryllus bimaculatus]|nr:Protein of unknown function [Gryllus bimaculatus]